MRILAPLVLLLALASCRTFEVEQIATASTSFGANHDATVAVDVHGGSGGAFLYSQTLGPKKFGEAIRASIAQTLLFTDVAEPEQADYLLDVDLNYAASHPGFTMTSNVNATWSLFRTGAEQALWSEEVATEGEGTMGDSFNGGTRQIIAIERAARANIDAALEKVAGLQLVEP